MPSAATQLLNATPFDPWHLAQTVSERTRCACRPNSKRGRLVVLTGAPELGKRELLTTIRGRLCEHVTVLPDAAKIVLQAGFSTDGPRCQAAAQRAIYHLQRELEQAALEDGRYSTVLCDGGSLDGLAHWPLDPRRFFAELGTTRKAELARYAAVIHLRRASERDSQVRACSPDGDATAALDQRIADAWKGHPCLHVVDAASDVFL